MWHFISSIFNKVISLTASVIIAVGIVSVPEPVNIQIPQIDQPRQEIVTEQVQEETVEKNSEIEELKKEVEELKKLQEKTSVPKEKELPKAKELPKQKEIKTIILSNGAVIDEAGNIISEPIRPIPQETGSNITAGVKILTGEEIYSLVSSSVILIKSSEGHGTGFVVENGKYIITNAHVVGSDNEVMLTFQNGESISGVVLGKNEEIDIALIYNKLNNVKAVTFGPSDSSSLKIGSDVYVLGIPLNSKVITITKGVVSANKQIENGKGYIQTDATTHPGNSGGPLVNNKGEVVGVHARRGEETIVSGTGYSLSIPIETVKSFIPSLSQYGQSRYELYPIGSTFSIKRSFAVKISFNSSLSCSQLQPINDNEMKLCVLYKDYYKDYNWNIIEDIPK